jgi:hypothetical protein
MSGLTQFNTFLRIEEKEATVEEFMVINSLE